MKSLHFHFNAACELLNTVHCQVVSYLPKAHLQVWWIVYFCRRRPAGSVLDDVPVEEVSRERRSDDPTLLTALPLYQHVALQPPGLCTSVDNSSSKFNGWEKNALRPDGACHSLQGDKFFLWCTESSLEGSTRNRKDQLRSAYMCN